MPKTIAVKQEKHDGEREVKWPGARIALGDKFFIVPPLSIGQLETYKELIERARKAADHDSMSMCMPLLLSAFNRNYPELTLGQLKEYVDCASYNVICLALFNISGIEDDDEGVPGEEKPAGN